MIRKIIDTNYLQDPKLRVYLGESKNNFVILTEYLAMEAYKESSCKSIFKLVDILKNFTDQIIILKCTIDICGLIFEPEQSIDHLIDKTQTNEFNFFCMALRDPKNIEQFISEHQEAAIFQMNRLISDSGKFLDGCKDILPSLSANELKIIRRKEPYTEEIITKIFNHTLLASMEMFQSHPKATKLPSIDELPDTFIFHNCLCAVLIFIKWVERGSPDTVSEERTRNDIVDANYASFALYFDDLLTNDKNLKELYIKAKDLLHTFKEQLDLSKCESI